MTSIHIKKLASVYLNGLNDKFVKPAVEPFFDNVYHIFNIRHPERDRIKRYLKENGIGTEIHYPAPPHEQKALNEMIGLNFPISSEIHRSTLSLPCSFAHSVNDIYTVTTILNNF